MSSEPSALSPGEAPGSFAARHIGPDEAERQAMLAVVGAPTLDALIDEAIPPQIDPLGYVVADVSKLRGLGWKPQHDLRRGLEKLLASVRPGASVPPMA